VNLSQTGRSVWPFWNTVVVAVLAALVVLSIRAYGPPPPDGQDTSVDEFSAQRAQQHVPHLAPEPHSTGSAANDEVRRYLADQLTAMGLEVTEQRGRSTNDLGSTPYGGQFRSSAEISNVVGLLRANRPADAPSTDAILVSAHYDSVPRGAGVHDNAMSAAAVLETVRALAQESKRNRDIYVLFPDGEELGLLGSRYFATQHPAMREIATVVNVDSRGGGGPSLMYEAGSNSVGLVKSYAGLAPDARTSSLFNALYEFLPNSTDFSELAIDGRRGLNFANIGRFTSYHSPTEDVSDLNLRTLQHHGANVLSGVRAALQPESESGIGDGAVYFTVWGDTFIIYPRWLSLTLGALASATVLALSLLVARRERLRVRSYTWALIFLIVSTVVVAAVVTAFVRVALGKNPQMAYWGTVDTPWPYWAAVAFIAFVAGAWMPHHLRGVEPPAVLVIAGALSGLGLMALTMLAPGAEYLALTLALGYALALGAHLVRRRPVAWSMRIAAVGAVCCILAPTLALAQDAFGLAGAVLVAPGWGLLTTLGSVLLRRTGSRSAVLDAWSGGVVVLSILTAVTLTRSDGPAPQDILYVHDADNARSTWAAVNPNTGLWDRLGGSDRSLEKIDALFPGWTREFAVAPAPPFVTAAPEVQMTGSGSSGDTQQVELTVRSTREAEDGVLLIRGAKVRSFAVEGTPATTSSPTPANEWWELWLWANGSDPVTISLTIDSGDFEVIYADRSDGVVSAEVVPSDLTAPAIDTAFFTNGTYVSTRHQWDGRRLVSRAPSHAIKEEVK
jgi:hypothetical protein